MPISKIKSNSITDDAITSAKIAAGVVSASDVADGTLTGAKLTTPLDLSSTVITAPKIADGGFIADANGNEEIKFTTTASAVNELTVANAATGTSPTISATGGDTNIGINLTPKGTGGIVLPAGAVGTPALTTSGDLNTGIFFPSADTIAFTEGGTEAMRIDSSGNVGIGTTAPAHNVEIVATASGSINDSLQIRNNATATGTGSRIRFINSTDANSDLNGASIASLRNSDDNFLIFETENTERMRIDYGGNVFIGKTSSSASTIGIEIQGGGFGVFTRDSDTPMLINRLTNDGTLISFRQASTEEGTISVLGSTVGYNGFTGSHWSRFIDESKPDVLRGTVMESLDQMTDWYHVEFTDSENNTQKKPYALKANEQEGDVITYNFEGTDYQAIIVKEKDVKHVMSKISDTSEAKNVYGVFSAWDNDDLINNDFYVASVGSFVVRIKAGENVNKGDLLQSNGDGTAKVQADDIVRASSFAKVLSNTKIQTYEDGSFIVPCSLMC